MAQTIAEAMQAIPQKREAPTQEALDAVERVVASFMAERAVAIAASPEARPPTPPNLVHEHLLLREYDKLAARGDTCAGARASLLRSKLGEKECGVRA